jgi:hypothetical protein
MVRQKPMKSIDIGGRSLIEGNNNIAVLDTGLHRRTVGLDAYNKDSTCDREAMASNEPSGQGSILARDTNVSAPDLAILDEAACNELCGIDSGCKADTLRRKDDRSIHSDYLAL